MEEKFFKVDNIILDLKKFNTYNICIVTKIVYNEIAN